MKKLLVFFISICALGLSVANAHASVLINEVYSFGTNDDWVELYATDQTDISGWKLHDSSNASPLIGTIPQNTTISQSGFYIVEVDDRLNKTEDVITLFKSDGTIIDTFKYGQSNSVCAPGSGQSVGRYPQDSSGTIDRFSSPTKGTTNSSATLIPCSTPTPQVTNTPTNTPTLIPTPIPTSTPTKIPSKTPTPTEIEKTLAETDEVDSKDDTPTPNPSLPRMSDSQKEDGNNFPIPIPAIFLGIAGIIFMALGIILYLKKRQEV